MTDPGSKHFRKCRFIFIGSKYPLSYTLTDELQSVNFCNPSPPSRKKRKRKGERNEKYKK